MNNSSLWRMASVSPTVMGIPCLAYCPIFIWLLHFRMWTLMFSIVTIVFSGILARYGYTYTVFIRKILYSFRGKQILLKDFRDIKKRKVMYAKKKMY